MTLDNIVNGFKATGLYPYNSAALPEEAYAPSVLTERPLAPENITTDNITSLSVMNFREQLLQRSDNNDSDSDKTFYEEQYNDYFAQKSPSPGCSGINMRQTVQRTDFIDSDSYNSLSLTLLNQEDFLVSISSTTEIKSRLVDYSSSGSEQPKSNIPAKPSNLDVTVRRPIIYSSESDSSVITESFIARPKVSHNIQHNIYNSSDNENIIPLSRQLQHTPQKNTTCYNTNYVRQVRESCSTTGDSTATSDSEDNLPLASLNKKKVLKSPFQQLIPTPNFAVAKGKKPRRKAINYKARIVTKDLFTERENKKKISAKQQHSKQNVEEQQSKMKNKGKCVKKSSPKKRNNGKTSKINPADKWYCHACNAESFEDMRQCPMCQRWFHELCVGLTKDDSDFECPMCN